MKDLSLLTVINISSFVVDPFFIHLQLTTFKNYY